MVQPLNEAEQPRNENPIGAVLGRSECFQIISLWIEINPLDYLATTFSLICKNFQAYPERTLLMLLLLFIIIIIVIIVIMQYSPI